MPDAMQWSILNRMDPPCLTAGRPSAIRQEVLHA
jgi:hypothetical protein